MRPLASIAAASVLAAAATIVGCSGDPEEAPDYQVTDDNNITAQDPAPPAAADPGEEPAKPAPDFVVDPEPFTDGSMDDAGAMPDGGAAPKPDAGTTAPVTKTMSCVSTYGSHKSTSTLTWVVSGSTATIHSLYVTVHNAYGRNANDVDVWVKYPNQTEYLAFNSGDVLLSDKKINVRLPADWKKPVGTRIRLETNFDQSGSDPSASCSITLTK